MPWRRQSKLFDMLLSSGIVKVFRKIYSIESPVGVKRKDYSACTVTMVKKGWEIVQKWLIKRKLWYSGE